MPERNASNRLTSALSRKTRQARCGVGEAGKVLRSEVFQIEQLADLLPRSGGNHQAGRCGDRLQPRRKVGRLADNRLFLRRARADQIADDHQPGGYSDAHLQFGGSGVEASDAVDQAQSGPDRPLGVVFMGSRVAEIDQHAVAHILGDKAIEPRDNRRHRAVIGADQVAQILRVELRRKRGRTDEIAEHHRQLSALGIGWRRRIADCRCYGGSRRVGAECGNGVEQPPAMAYQGNAEFFQILGCQACQQFGVNSVIAECWGVLFEPQLAQPIGDLDRHRPCSHQYLHLERRVFD